MTRYAGNLRATMLVFLGSAVITQRLRMYIMRTYRRNPLRRPRQVVEAVASS